MGPIPSAIPATGRPACGPPAGVCLTSRFPMIVWWGPELRFLYNDAYRPLLGDKHPALDLPGRQVWSEIWDTIGPMLDSVMSSGQATWSEDLLLPMRRHGYWEETYWTYSYSPLHDDDGTVRGVFTAVTESTEQVVGRHRLAVLQDLGAQAGRGRGVAEVCDLVVGTLSRARQDVPYAAIYLRGAGGDGDVAAGTAPCWPPAAPLPGTCLASGRGAAKRASLPRWPTWRTASGGCRQVTGRIRRPRRWCCRCKATTAARWASSCSRPVPDGRSTRPTVDFLGLVARQSAALVNGAIAYQAQLRRAEESSRARPAPRRRSSPTSVTSSAPRSR